MAIDQRLFDYPLDVCLQRLRWRMDERMAALAAALSRQACLAEEGVALACRTTVASSDATPASQGAIDLGRARHALAFLGRLHAARAELASRVADCEHDVAEQRSQLDALRLEIEQIERDREDCLREHGRELDRRAARESDHDWTVRARWRASRQGASR